jgi:hypothetical protein
MSRSLAIGQLATADKSAVGSSAARCGRGKTRSDRTGFRLSYSENSRNFPSASGAAAHVASRGIADAGAGIGRHHLGLPLHRGRGLVSGSSRIAYRGPDGRATVLGWEEAASRD